MGKGRQQACFPDEPFGFRRFLGSGQTNITDNYCMLHQARLIHSPQRGNFARTIFKLHILLLDLILYYNVTPAGISVLDVCTGISTPSTEAMMMRTETTGVTTSIRLRHHQNSGGGASCCSSTSDTVVGVAVTTNKNKKKLRSYYQEKETIRRRWYWWWRIHLQTNETKCNKNCSFVSYSY